MGRKRKRVEYYLMEFPNRLGDARENAGLTQKQTAEELGMTLSNYQFLEYGKTELKSTWLVKMAKLFGCTTDYLIYFDDIS